MNYFRTIITAILLLSNQMLFAAAGDPLAGFGTNGLSEHSPSGMRIVQLIQLKDGGFIAASNLSIADDNSALTRFKADGSIDTSFGTNGTISSFIGLAGGFFTQGVVEQADGKIVLLGRTPTTGKDKAATRLARIHPNGQLDTSFSEDGIVTVSMTKDDAIQYPQQIIVQSDGKIVVAGYVATTNENHTRSLGIVVWRFLENGSLDTSFDNDGIFQKVHTSTGQDGFNAVAQQPDGKLVLAGFTDDNIKVVGKRVLLYRLNLDGSIDTSFNTVGYVETALDTSPNDTAINLALQSNGNIIVATTATGPLGSGNANIFSYSSDGTLNNSVGNNGVITGLDFVSSIVGISIDAEQRMILTSMKSSGTFSSNIFAYIQRFNTDGSPDTSFNTTGTKLLDTDNDSYALLSQSSISRQGIIIDGDKGYFGITDKYGRVRIIGVSMSHLVSDNTPVADAGGPYVINENQNLELDASKSEDLDDDDLSYDWDIDNDGNFDEAISGERVILEPAVYRALGLLTDGSKQTITLRVTDGANSSTTTADVTINNVAPVAVAQDITIIEGLPAVFTATASSDILDNLTVAWDIDNDGSYDDGKQLIVAKTWEELQALGLGVGSHTVKVRVVDAEGESDFASLTLTIQANGNTGGGSTGGGSTGGGSTGGGSTGGGNTGGGSTDGESTDSESKKKKSSGGAMPFWMVLFFAGFLIRRYRK